MTCDRVVFVEDDADVRAANVQALELEGLRVSGFAGAREAAGALSRDFPGVVVSDLRMPGEDGHALFRRIRTLDPELPVILITGHADVAEAVQALHDGAYDFVSKPFAPARLLASVRRALATRALVLENRRLRALTARSDAAEGLMGDSAAMRRLRATVERLAGADLDVVVEGEGGSGKETLARALHRASRRRGSFVAVGCADLAEDEAEAELFGVAAGFASGSPRARAGRIEASHRGVLFLDEVEHLPPRLQARLLRVLEAQEVTAVGAASARPVDVRVIAACEATLHERVAAGAFRADLFHRLNGVTLRAPPLRERREDLPLLFGRFVSEAARRVRKPEPPLTPAVQQRLLTHDWPGNLPELRSFAEWVALGLPETEGPDAASASLQARVAAFEAALLREALSKTRGQVTHALKLLQLPRKTFYDKLARHDLRATDFRS